MRAPAGARALTARTLAARASQVLSHHSDSVYAVALAAADEGRMRVALGSGDDTGSVTTVRLSDGERATVKLEGHTDTVATVAFNSDGSLLATGGYEGLVKVRERRAQWTGRRAVADAAGGTQIWEAETGALKQTLEGPGSEIEWVRWHPKGPVVIAGSGDGTAWMWLATDGTCMQVFAGHEDAVTCGCFNGTGRMVCTGSADGTVRVWKPKTGTAHHVFRGHGWHEGPIIALAAQPDVSGARQAPMRAAWLTQSCRHR